MASKGEMESVLAVVGTGLFENKPAMTLIMLLWTSEKSE